MQMQVNNVQETYAFGYNIGELLQAGSCIALHGNLGSGKTTFVQAIAKGLGIDENVTSPTYIYMQQYMGRCDLYHIDAYRITDEDEAYEIGIEDCFSDDAITIVEWPENVSVFLPHNTLHVKIMQMNDVNDIDNDDIDGMDKRIMKIISGGEHYPWLEDIFSEYNQH